MNKSIYELNRHEITVSLIQDADNQTEGYSVGQAVELGLGKHLWLQPGVTFNEHVLDNQGTIGIPLISATEGKVTELCADGNVGTANEKRVPLSINKKVSGKFDGCFTVAGIADKTIQRALNDAKLRVMANVYTKYVEAEMIKGSTQSTLDKASFKDNPRAYLAAAKNEAYKLSTKFPTIALVSLDFQLELDNAKALRPTVEGDAQYVYGAVGTTAGLLVIAADIKVDFILFSYEDLHIATPASPAQINTGILGDITTINGFSFNNGMASFLDVNASAGSAHTFLHKYFGTLITDKTLMLKAKAIV